MRIVKKTKKIFIFIIIHFMIVIPAFVYSQDKNNKSDKWEESFFKGNQYYKNGKYESALESYLEVLGSGHRSGDLYYNMGNTCYRLNMLGYSILYYERAKNYMPSDEDLDFNLRFVKKFTKDAVEYRNDMLSGTFFWTDSMTIGQIFWLFALVNFLLWAVLGLRLFLKKEWTYYLPFIFLTAWLISGASFAWKYYFVKSDNRAVVLSEEADILSGPDAGNTLLFKLHSGTIVMQVRSEDNWKLISLPDNKRGWIAGSAVERIRE